MDGRPLTPQSEADDYDPDFPDDAPFWYGSASGEQRFHKDHRHLPEPQPTPVPPAVSARRNSYHDNDSVLHYFIATTQSEEKLERYLSDIINVFLDEPGPIYAGQAEPAEMLQARFSASEVPLRRRRSSCGLNGMPTSVEEYLQTVKANVIDRATRVSSPKMIGHMTTALPYFHRPLSRLLTAMNQNVVKLETASTMTYLERQTVGMLHREFYGAGAGFYKTYLHSPEHSLGVFCSGGTIANITAMWAARNMALGPDANSGFAGIEKEGLFAALTHYGHSGGAVIVGSRLMHYSFKKAADLLGLGDNGLVTVDADDAFRMKVDELERTLDDLQKRNVRVVAVVGIAGTTETGSIDPLARIAAVCAARRIHFHVDGAWGAPLVFSAEHRRKLKGIELADTITVDGHKQLYTPMGLGLLLFKEPTTAHSIRKTANYIIRHNSPDLGKFTLEGSRPATSLHLHASLYLLGRDGLATLVTRSATLARQMAARVATHPSGCFQPLHVPETNIFLFRYLHRAVRRKVQEGQLLTDEEEERVGECTRRIQIEIASTAGSEPADPTTGASSASAAAPPSSGFVSRTRVRFRGRDADAFRVVIANPLTSWDDVEDVVRSVVAVGERVEADIERKANSSTAEYEAAATRRRQSIIGEVDERWKTMDLMQPPWIGWPFDI
ncbi:pyridoxal phosphate-dependent transferase [Geranomyces variabilis]|nr:pyridoxal phosphate-dependent transferase [Geranomyces variabilis]KAJ3142853.1 hypothetical protein HDU90_002724 [Geranomyces variabilis]